MRRAGALLGGALLVLGGCATAPEGPDKPLLPWDGTVPAEVRPATVAPARPCPASELTAVDGGFRFAPAVSGGTGIVTLRHTGTSACRLAGRPDVRVAGAVP